MWITRRELLKLAAGSGLSMALGWRPRFGQASELVTKPIPSSGERVPVVGIGTRNYRGGPDSPEWGEWRATLKAFAELGGVVLDTAPSYGNSETVVGTLMAELGITDDLFIATKVDREGREAGIERMESSFEKLRTDVIDLMQGKASGPGGLGPLFQARTPRAHQRELGRDEEPVGEDQQDDRG